MPCSVCNHPQRRAIDLAMLSRTATLAQLSEQHRLSTSALHRHKQHLQQKTAAAQNRFRNLLREGSLVILSSLLEGLLKITANAEAEGNAAQVLQGARQSTDIIKLMHKLGLDLDPDSLYRLLESPRWADQDSLLPDDRRFTADCRQDLADYLGAPCPEPDAAAAAPVKNQAAAALLAELAGLSQGGSSSVKREKSGKLPGKTAAKIVFIKEKQNVKQGEKNSAAPSPSPLLKPGTAGSSGSWVEDLDAGRLSLDFLHAVGVGRQPLDPSAVAGIF